VLYKKCFQVNVIFGLYWSKMTSILKTESVSASRTSLITPQESTIQNIFPTNVYQLPYNWLTLGEARHWLLKVQPKLTSCEIHGG
jgi:hypothetical protein